MKKTTVICAMLACLLTFSFCKKEIPDTAIRNFLGIHFPDAAVAAITRDGSGFDAVLVDNTKVDFDSDAEWEEIDCEHSTVYLSVPETLVPEQIMSYVNTCYPANRIVKISRNRRGWEIELDNGVDIDFDKDFNVTEIDI